MVKNLAVIPARSGSKRIPDKNIMDFMNKPLIAHTIEAALKSNLFEDVIVSTDSLKYAEIANKYGAWVPFLRDKYCDDYSTLNNVMIHVLDSIYEKTGKTYDSICSLQVSCPLRNESVIREVYSFFTNTNAPTVLSCSMFNFMNPWWAFKMENNSEASFININPMDARSQDKERLFFPTGAVGFAKTKDFRKDPSFYGKGHKYFPIDWKYAIDIDNYEDVEFAKAVYKMVNSCSSD
jgi:N-acylneuraminate cytidylyltransferase